MRIKTVKELLQHETVASLRGGYIVTFQVNRTYDGRIELVGIRSSSPAPNGHRWYDMKLTPEEMQEYASTDLYEASGLFSTEHELQTLIKSNADKEFQTLVDLHGQSKEDFVYFLLDYAKSNAQSSEHFDQTTLDFVNVMAQKYIE